MMRKHGIGIIILTFLFINPSKSQDILQLLDEFVMNSHEILGKPFYSVYRMKKPDYLKNASKWELKPLTPVRGLKYNKIIQCNTGTGAIIHIFFSSQTSLAYQISFSPNVFVDSENFNEYLEKYNLDESGTSKIIPTIFDDHNFPRCRSDNQKTLE